jgi:hypothetical protein
MIKNYLFLERQRELALETLYLYCSKYQNKNIGIVTLTKLDGFITVRDFLNKYGEPDNTIRDMYVYNDNKLILQRIVHGVKKTNDANFVFCVDKLHGRKIWEYMRDNEESYFDKSYRDRS